MAIKVILFIALAATFVLPDFAPSYNAPAPLYSAPTEEEAEAQYDFSYAVKDEYSRYNFGHQESQESSETVGTYYVQLPDGRLQSVTYTVDGDSGYLAEVSYEGEAEYPQQQQQQQQPAAHGGYA